MIRPLKILAGLLTRRERRQGVAVLAMAALLGLLETGSVAAVVPFLGVVGNRDLIREVPLLAWAYQWFGFESERAFILALGCLSAVVLLSTSLFKVLTRYVVLRFIAMRRHSISRRLFRNALYQKYPFFLTRNSADLTKDILSETDVVVQTVLAPLIDMTSYLLVGMTLIGFLLYVDPVLAGLLGFGIGGAYALLYSWARSRTTRTGRETSASNLARFQCVREALGGIKEIKLQGSEELFLERFEPASYYHASHQATNQALAHAPRYAIEGVAFVAVIATTVYLVLSSADVGTVLPVLGAYVLAGYRLLPAIQHIYSGAIQIRFGTAAAEALLKSLACVPQAAPRTDVTPMPLRDSIRLDAVSFTYPGAERPSLDRVSLSIRAGQTVGLIGETGSGKTTLADVLLGLLVPTGGRILVDDRELTEENLSAWQRGIGYVPQTLYLLDDSVRANIAFGDRAASIDDARVEAAARVAQVHDFVVEQLPQGYHTSVGEAGVRVSGGQRQRMCLARALYRDPDVLVIDEGTSALDGVTEAAVMGALQAVSRQKTVIIIAHRLTTVRSCDRLFMLEGGRLIAEGTYEELEATSEPFRAFVSLGAKTP